MPQHAPNRKLTILLVEDNDFLRKTFCEAFRDKHSILSASSAEEGWALYVDRLPDIVFLDIGLPDASGHILAGRIKEKNPSAYVIMATASDYAEDVEAAGHNHVEGFITKPFDKKKIESYIEKYAETRRQSS
ncbi:MAG: response regulator [Alphaproteobacteria bacterium]|nr:response regulator [Alphaproteobacteria bacterium]